MGFGFHALRRSGAMWGACARSRQLRMGKRKAQVLPLGTRVVQGTNTPFGRFKDWGSASLAAPP